MKRNLIRLGLCLLASGLCARADFTADVDAGELTGPLGATLPTGSLLLLIDTGSSTDPVSNLLTAGQYVSGTNFVLAAGAFDTAGGTAETLTSFIASNPTTLPNSATPSGNVPQNGDIIALRWFDGVTLSQYDLGATTVAGDTFGTYTTLIYDSTPDGGDPFVVPGGGEINLDFYTSNSEYGGTQLPTEGYASNIVVAVPEPSSFALFVLSMLLGVPCFIFCPRTLALR